MRATIDIDQIKKGSGEQTTFVVSGRVQKQIHDWIKTHNISIGKLVEAVVQDMMRQEELQKLKALKSNDEEVEL